MGYCKKCKCKECSYERLGRKKGFRKFLDLLYHTQIEKIGYVLIEEEAVWEELKQWIYSKDPCNITVKQLEMNSDFEASRMLKEGFGLYLVCRFKYEDFYAREMLLDFGTALTANMENDVRWRDKGYIILTDSIEKFKEVKEEFGYVPQCYVINCREDNDKEREEF